MAYDFSKANKNKPTVNEQINTKELDYKPLKELCGQEVQIFGYFFTKGKFGRQVVLVSDSCLINMPARAVEEIEDLVADGAKEDIINGCMKLVDIEEGTTSNGNKTVFYSFANA